MKYDEFASGEVSYPGDNIKDRFRKKRKANMRDI